MSVGQLGHLLDCFVYDIVVSVQLLWHVYAMVMSAMQTGVQAKCYYQRMSEVLL